MNEMIHDLIANKTTGETYKELNAKKRHAIPIGSLVELESGVRLFVVHHGRDCDMTPLYSIAVNKDDIIQNHSGLGNYGWSNGYSEDSLKVVSRGDEMINKPQHPTQPLVTDDDGVTRFKENPIVRFLLETHSLHDLNSLHLIPFDNEHWVQFHQLIGVSLQLFADIDYISDEDYHRAASPGRRMILPEFNFQIEKDRKNDIERLLEECGISNFWIAPIGEDRLTITIEADYERIERFNEKRKVQR